MSDPTKPNFAPPNRMPRQYQNLRPWLSKSGNSNQKDGMGNDASLATDLAGRKERLILTEEPFDVERQSETLKDAKNCTAYLLREVLAIRMKLRKNSELQKRCSKFKFEDHELPIGLFTTTRAQMRRRLQEAGGDSMERLLWEEGLLKAELSCKQADLADAEGFEEVLLQAVREVSQRRLKARLRKDEEARWTVDNSVKRLQDTEKSIEIELKDHEQAPSTISSKLESWEDVEHKPSNSSHSQATNATRPIPIRGRNEPETERRFSFEISGMAPPVSPIERNDFIGDGRKNVSPLASPGSKRRALLKALEKARSDYVACLEQSAETGRERTVVVSGGGQADVGIEESARSYSEVEARIPALDGNRQDRRFAKRSPDGSISLSTDNTSTTLPDSFDESASYFSGQLIRCPESGTYSSTRGPSEIAEPTPRPTENELKAFFAKLVEGAPSKPA